MIFSRVQTEPRTSIELSDALTDFVVDKLSSSLSFCAELFSYYWMAEASKLIVRSSEQ